MDTIETILCSHCNKEVAKANFDLHEPHCKRFLCLCPDCDETVPREQLEDHKSEQHAEVKCQKCRKKMERRHLLDHEANDCPHRLEKCEYCELELPYDSLLKHSLSCGSRTERCHDCGRYVQFKDKPEHAKEDCSKNPLTSMNSSSDDDEADVFLHRTSRCRKCQKAIPSYSLVEHELDCNEALQFVRNEADFDRDLNFGDISASDTAAFSFLQFQSKKKERYMEKELDMISTCKLCHLALPIKTLEWHEEKCKLYKHLNLAQ